MNIEKDGLRKKMISNTIANYVRLGLNFFIGIFLTRTLFLGLTREEYGMWALLWTVFGYSVLLDFGFGTAVQKATSETLVTKEWKKFNRLISTVFFNYIVIALIISAIAVILSFNIDRVFSFDSVEKVKYFRKVFLVFGVGTSLGFPFGFTMEILLGLNEIRLRNMIQIGAKLFTFLILYFVVTRGYSIMEMAIGTIIVNMTANMVQTFFVFKKIPSLKVSLKLYDRKQIKSVMSFSLFAYIIIFTNLIIFRTDQIVISVFSSVSLVAIYQIASRLAETYKMFSSQFLDNLRPIAAILFISNQKSKLAKILIESNRLLGFFATLMIIPLLIFLKEVLSIWLELSDPAGTICAIILLLSMYFYVFFRSSSVYILLMSNAHKQLTIVAIIECIINLVLSIFLIKRIGIVGVAIGTIVPNILAAIFYNIPKACQFAEISFKEFFSQAIFRTAWIGMITASIIYIISTRFRPSNLLELILHFSLSSIIFLVLYYFFGVYGWERKQFNEFISKKFIKIARSKA